MSARRVRHLAFLGFHADPGGIGKVMVNLINALAVEGVAVDVLLTSPDAADARHLDTRVRTVHIPGRKGSGLARPLAGYLRAHRPDALVTNKEWANRTAALARARFAAPGRLVFRVGTTGTVALARRPLPKRLLRRWAMAWSYRRADRVIAVSQGVADDTRALLGLPAERVAVVHNPSVPADLAARAREPVDHPWFQGSGSGTPVLLAVGRLVEPKGFPVLLEAFARLRRDRPCRLVVLGEGGMRPELTAQAERLGIADGCDLPGYRDNPYAYMARAALFALSSSREGFPNVLAEALAVGTPVVATDCPSGPREILDGGRYGPLVPVGDAAALADALAATLDAPLPREVLQEAGQRFTAERAARAYLEVIEGCIPG